MIEQTTKITFETYGKPVSWTADKIQKILVRSEGYATDIRIHIDHDGCTMFGGYWRSIMASENNLRAIQEFGEEFPGKVRCVRVVVEERKMNIEDAIAEVSDG